MKTQSDSSVTLAKPLSDIAQLTEAVEFYRRKLLEHPMATLAMERKLSFGLLQEFAKIQFVDSVLWIPMLSLIKGKVTEPRLLKAVTDNILCESGYSGTPHTTLCKNFIESIGVQPFFGDYHTYSPLSAHSVEIMNAITGMSENQLCGWLLVAEDLVPTLFQIFRPAFAGLPNVDTQYLDEHIHIDADEHANWMREGAQALLAKDKNALSEIMSGVDLGGRVTLSIPDVLYARALREKRV